MSDGINLMVGTGVGGGLSTVFNGDLWELHDALVPLVQKGQIEQSEDALRIELTQERFGNLVAFRIGKSPRRFWCWEGARR